MIIGILETGFPSFKSGLSLVVHGFVCLLTALIIRSCFHCYACAEPMMQFIDAATTLYQYLWFNVLTFNQDESKR